MLAVVLFIGSVCFCANGDKVIPSQTLNNILISNVRNQVKTIETSLAGQLKAVEESVSLIQVSCSGVLCNDCQGRQNIGFQATFSVNLQNVGRYATVVFNKVIENKGEAYNSTSGVFTTPSDGLYVFHWTILTRTGGRFNSALKVNDQIKTFNHAESDRIKDHNSGSQMYVGDLKKGDKVMIVGYGNDGRFAYANWSSFSGFKL